MFIRTCKKKLVYCLYWLIINTLIFTFRLPSQDNMYDSNLIEFKTYKCRTPEPVDTLKLEIYQNQRKNTATAALLSLCIPTAGHLYGKQWGRGLFYAGIRIGGVVLALTEGSESKEVQVKHLDTIITVKELTATFWTGIAFYTVFTIWEMIDAVRVTNEYNQALYRKIMHSRLNKKIEFQFSPISEGAKFGIRYWF